TFPDGNPGAGTTREQEVLRLLEKQEAGASFAITQLFYRAESYTGVVEAARAAGVTLPILAGVLPTTEARRLRRGEELTRGAAPSGLLRALDRLTATDGAVGAEAQHAHGVEFSAPLAREVLDAGAPGLHVYPFNRHRPALDLLARTGLTGRAAA